MTTDFAFSGRELVVMKSGKGMSLQRYMLQVLEPFTPEVKDYGTDWYTMDLLSEPDLEEAGSLYDQVVLMLHQIWLRDAPSPEDVSQYQNRYVQIPWPSEWESPFNEWRTAYPWIGKAPRPHRLCMIHGDMTLANVMERNGQAVLIDPVLSNKIPSCPEVDVGKMLQSCAGWEGLLNGTLKKYWSASRVRRDFPIFYKRGLYWCAVHFARIIPYAIAKGKIEIAAWVEFQSKQVMKEYLKCISST